MIRLSYTEMNKAIEDLVKENILIIEVQCAQNKDILELECVKDLFTRSGWTMSEFHALTKYDRDPLDIELEDIAMTLTELGYSEDLIEKVLIAFIAQRK